MSSSSTFEEEVCCSFPDYSDGYISDCRGENGKVVPFREAFSKFLSNTTMHGAPRVWEGGGHFRRIVWLILFLTGSFFMIYFSKGLIKDYTNYGKNTVITYLNVPEIHIPDITICGQAGVHQYDLPPLDYGLGEQWAYNRLGSILRWSWGPRMADKKGFIDNLTWEEVWVQKAPTTTAQIHMLPKTGIPKSTRCYFLNMSQSQLTAAIVPGFATALSVTIDLALWNWTDAHNSPFTMTPIPTTAGVSVDVTSPYQLPHPPNEGAACSAGGECKVGISLTKINRLGDSSGSSHFGNCQDNVTIHRPYSITTCKSDCFLKSITKCQSIKDRAEYHAAKVDYNNAKTAYANANSNTKGKKGSVAKNQSPAQVQAEIQQNMEQCMDSLRCIEHCYPACVEWRWAKKHAYMPLSRIPVAQSAGFRGLNEWIDFQTAHQKAILAHNLPQIMNTRTGTMDVLNCSPDKPCMYGDLLQYAKQNVVTVSVFPETMTVVRVTEEPKVELITLLSQMGGNIGLFVGISFMTIFEWLEFIGVAIITYGFVIWRTRARDQEPLLGGVSKR